MQPIPRFLQVQIRLPTDDVNALSVLAEICNALSKVALEAEVEAFCEESRSDDDENTFATIGRWVTTVPERGDRRLRHKSSRQPSVALA